METTINRNSYNVAKEEARNHPKFDRNKIMEAWRMIFEAVGKNPDSDALKDSPERIARLYEIWFEGEAYTNAQIAEMFNTTFETVEDNDDLVTMINIPCFSTCEHHAALMYSMKVSIGYIPVKGKVIGLSKMARIAQMVCHRFQLQERIGEDIAEIMKMILGTEDIIVVISSKHACVTAKPPYSDSITKTATLKGRFRTVSDLRKEFYSLID